MTFGRKAAAAQSTSEPAALDTGPASDQAVTRSSARWLGRLGHRELTWRSLLSSAGELLFVLPVIAIIGVLILVPTMTAIIHSFTNWNPGYASPFVGLENYKTLATSPVFHTILANEGFLLLGLPLWVGLPLLLAFLLYDKVPLAGFIRTIFFFPATASPALIGILFTIILGPQGPLNSALSLFGWRSPPDWLVSTGWVKPVLICVLAWATIGTGIMIFSAGLTAIPPELFEIAQIDGVGWWGRLRYVALPALRRITELWTVILVITVFVAMFPWVYTLTLGGPGYTSTTIDYDIYQNALTNGYFGLAAAEMVYMLILIGLVLLTGWLLFSRAGRSEAKNA
jgi:ABC-type sugar transport system permease subunit